MRLKANRPALHQMVAAYFADPQTLATLASEQTTNGDNGRIEVRRAYVSHDLGWMCGTKTACTEPATLPDLACLGIIEATVERGGKTTVTRHYHLSSRSLSPKDCLAAARARWTIENGLHWVLDVVFDEDQARNRKDHAPENLAFLRKLALNVRNQSRPGISIRRKSNQSGWSDEFARSVIGQMR